LKHEPPLDETPIKEETLDPTDIAEIKEPKTEIEPSPPGVEHVGLKLRLVGRKLTNMPPVLEGTEQSALCSII
jgi:hypothetical protein